MGIINWVQNRFNGRPEKKRSDSGVNSARNVPSRDSCQDVRDENVSDWPQGLLSIGTFGNNELKDQEPAPARQEQLDQDPRASQDLPDFTIEEVKKLQEALTKLLRRKSKSSGRGLEAGEEERANLPLDRFLNCPSSLEVDRRAGQKQTNEADNNNEIGDLSLNTKIILTKARDLLINNNTNKQKSFKFLLKKLFVCGGGFAPAPSLKDPVESRMEKFFRTVLHRKMNVGPSNAASSKKYFLEDKPKGMMRRDHDEEEKGEDSFRWDKTDSEFIVLEI